MNNKNTDVMIVTKSKKMKQVLEQVHNVAKSERHVLILGESGSGRDTIAQMIHKKSLRAGEPMIKIDAKSAVERNLKLYGSGILYLDNVEYMTKKMQEELYHNIRRINMNMRVISSATSELGNRIDEERFGVKLYYELARHRIELPPLRDRSEDIDKAAKDMVKKFNKKFGKNTKIDVNALQILRQYKFGGNFTEMEYMLGLAVLKNKDGLIKANSLMSVIDMDNVIFTCLVKGNPLSLKTETQRLEKAMIIKALKDTRSANKAALQLGVDVSTISRKCKQYNMRVLDKESGESLI